jgi:hypothetical protein
MGIENQNRNEDGPVRPSFACALIVVTTRRNMAAGTTWTSSRRMKPHSRPVRKSIIFFASWDRLCVLATMEYVEMTIPLSPANWHHERETRQRPKTQLRA